LIDTAAQEGLRGGQSTDFLRQDVHERCGSIGTAVGQPGLEELPDALVGVQFRGVGWEGDQMEAGGAAEQILDRLPVMNAAIVEQHDEVARDRP